MNDYLLVEAELTCVRSLQVAAQKGEVKPKHCKNATNYY